MPVTLPISKFHLDSSVCQCIVINVEFFWFLVDNLCSVSTITAPPQPIFSWRIFSWSWVRYRRTFLRLSATLLFNDICWHSNAVLMQIVLYHAFVHVYLLQYVSTASHMFMHSFDTSSLIVMVQSITDVHNDKWHRNAWHWRAVCEFLSNNCPLAVKRNYVHLDFALEPCSVSKL